MEQYSYILHFKKIDNILIMITFNIDTGGESVGSGSIGDRVLVHSR